MAISKKNGIQIPLNRLYIGGGELEQITRAISGGHLDGDGPFTTRCNQWLVDQTGCKKALLTHSCTSALEMAALLCDIGPGDEVIMPSFTFVSTANAFALRGATPVFVDVRPDTLNIDETLIEAAITPSTRAIVPVHYAGVPCEMDTIMAIAEKHGLLVVEDAAQAILSRYKGRPLGSIGHLGCLSFHVTKNITCGEGGALLVNDPGMVQRAEIIREKGTNRSQFFRGEVDKYTWVDIGSSYLPSELQAAFLSVQFEEAEATTARRLSIWDRYHQCFEELEAEGVIGRPTVPDDCQHNAHLYYLMLPNCDERTAFISRLKKQGIQTAFHYVPLHTAPCGRRLGRVTGPMTNTDRAGDCLVRLPLWPGMEMQQERIIQRVLDCAAKLYDKCAVM
jgi:dTDP-4-amino-4,6-dideoxygalactose transaminase